MKVVFLCFFITSCVKNLVIKKNSCIWNVCEYMKNYLKKLFVLMLVIDDCIGKGM